MWSLPVPSPPLVLTFLALACAGPHEARDADVADCATGWRADGDVCVPEACGEGLWGDLPIDEATIHVDEAAADGGDGTAAAPLRALQPALDLAARRGGGLVAVAAGTYVEALTLVPDHAGLRLAGRCRDLVTLDASAAQEGVAGIDVDISAAEIEVSGLTVRGAPGVGIKVGSGVLRVADARIADSGYIGIAAYKSGFGGSSRVAVTRTEIARSATAGVLAYNGGAEVELDEVSIRGVVPRDGESLSYGILATEGGTLSATHLEIAEIEGVGVAADGAGSAITLRDIGVRDIRSYGGGRWAYGLWIGEGATLGLDDGIVTRVAGVGAGADGADASATLRHLAIRGSAALHGEALVWGLVAMSGATVVAEGCEVTGIAGVGAGAASAQTRLTLRGTAIQNIIPSDPGSWAFGLSAADGATLEAEASTVAGVSGVGASAGGLGSVLVLRQTSVRGTLAAGTEGAGYGVLAYDHAFLHAEDTDIGENAVVGLSAADGARILLRGVSVRDTLPGEPAGSGIGVAVEGSAILEAENSEIVGNTWAGLVVTGAGTRADLRGTLVADTRLDDLGEGLGGINVDDAATLRAEGCRVAGNAPFGITAFDAGTTVTLVDVAVLETLPDGAGGGGYGLDIFDGATLSAVGCEVARSTGIGLAVDGSDTRVALRGTSVDDTLPAPSGSGGLGVVSAGGSTLVAEACEMSGNTGAGILASGQTTQVDLRDVTLAGTVPMNTDQGAVGLGLMVQDGAAVQATGMLAQDNAGPGIYAVKDGSRLSCSSCRLLSNAFAGAAVIDGALLDITASTIEGTVESVNLGGGAGVFAAQQRYGTAPTLNLSGTTVSGNPAAGVWLGQEGTYRLGDNVITGGGGVPFGSGTRCGDGVYAMGVAAWDETSGLALDGNTLSGNAGAGLFLDDASAAIEGNAWGGNDIDLWVQGEACRVPRDDYAEAPTSEICPAWDKPACEMAFSLILNLADIAAGRPAAPDLPTLGTSRAPSAPHPVSP